MSIDPEKKQFGAWWMWVVGLMAITIVIGTVLQHAGVFGRTVVEREVFENSYQYTAAQKEKISIIEAQLEEIRVKLSDQSLDESTRKNLESQQSVLRVRLRAAKEVSQ